MEANSAPEIKPVGQATASVAASNTAASAVNTRKPLAERLKKAVSKLNPDIVAAVTAFAMVGAAAAMVSSRNVELNQKLTQVRAINQTQQGSLRVWEKAFSNAQALEKEAAERATDLQKRAEIHSTMVTEAANSKAAEIVAKAEAQAAELIAKANKPVTVAAAPAEEQPGLIARMRLKMATMIKP
jgi:hypothetical protein